MPLSFRVDPAYAGPRKRTNVGHVYVMRGMESTTGSSRVLMYNIRSVSERPYDECIEHPRLRGKVIYVRLRYIAEITDVLEGEARRYVIKMSRCKVSRCERKQGKNESMPIRPSST